MKVTRTLSRRSFLGRVAGGAIVGGAALTVLGGTAEAQITDSDSGTIQEVRVSENNSKFAPATPASTPAESNCGSGATGPRSRWLTGHGLFIGSSCSRTVELYGQPGSRGPSTKDGQQLELLYYAFDWAGPDVPQVMAVLCTPGSNAKPGRVVEITLMAPSL